MFQNHSFNWLIIRIHTKMNCQIYGSRSGKFNFMQVQSMLTTFHCVPHLTNFKLNENGPEHCEESTWENNPSLQHKVPLSNFTTYSKFTSNAKSTETNDQSLKVAKKSFLNPFRSCFADLGWNYIVDFQDERTVQFSPSKFLKPLSMWAELIRTPKY